MLKRTLTAVGILAIVFGFVLGLRQIHVAFVFGLILVISVIGTYEMCKCLKATNEYNPMMIVNLIASVAISVFTYFFDYQGLVLSTLIFIIIMLSIFTFDHKYELKDVFASIFVLFYPIIPIALFIHINNLAVGLYAMLLTIFVPAMTDTMAYFTGFLIGGKKLCPTISPKKTVAGAIGGVFGGIIGALLIWLLFDVVGLFNSFNNVVAVSIHETQWIAILIYIALGAISAPICEIGDLIASWIKRKAGIKDYGNLFPGHGGVMDRIDSIIVMIPITLIFISILGL
ncbi:MAG: phosphatidate cytidylyltransferase [Christensenella sp.]|nr:phosphatidate cytidylyltransferase [Christensenella sp.]